MGRFALFPFQMMTRSEREVEEMGRKGTDAGWERRASGTIGGKGKE